LKSGFTFIVDSQQIDNVRILEVGFGTGLNFLVTAGYAKMMNIKLDYCGIEAFPLPANTIGETGYEKFIDSTIWENFITIYPDAINHAVEVVPGVGLEIAHTPVMAFSNDRTFDLVHFGAFAAFYQPEM